MTKIGKKIISFFSFTHCTCCSWSVIVSSEVVNSDSFILLSLFTWPFGLCIYSSISSSSGAWLEKRRLKTEQIYSKEYDNQTTAKRANDKRAFKTYQISKSALFKVNECCFFADRELLNIVGIDLRWWEVVKELVSSLPSLHMYRRNVEFICNDLHTYLLTDLMMISSFHNENIKID